MGSGDDDLLVRLAGNTVPVHPVLLARSDVRVALASHDIGVVFRVLNDHGWTQRGIARAVGMHQSEVGEILQGRRVSGFRVLVRVADGLGIPRAWMNLGPADGGGAYAGGVRRRELTREEAEEVRRRVMLALALGTAVEASGGRAGELAELPAPAPIPLPSRILKFHVVTVRELTLKLQESSRAHGSEPRVSSATADWATQLLRVPGAEPVRRALLTAVAELHNQAGYAAFDAGLHDRAMYHWTHELQLASKAGDAALQTLAMLYAGLAAVEHGGPNDGLKLLQLAQLKAGHIPVDDQRERVVCRGSRAVLMATTLAESGAALSRMGDPDSAANKLAEAREIWRPTPADPWGDLDEVAARLELERGRLDAAEPLAVASLRRWEAGHSQRARTLPSILLATIHVRAGEPGGLRLAHDAITGVGRLSSGLARRRLDPLASALETRPSSDHRQLAGMARQVATTGA